MKTKITLLLVLALVGMNCQGQEKSKSIPSNWKTYTNEKYGFSFRYPDSWVEDGKSIEAINLRNEITSVNISFTDSTLASKLTIEYFLPPNGKQLYDYSYSQFKSSQGWYANGSKQIKVASNDALVASNKLIKNGKGSTMNPPLRKIIVSFLDNRLTGEMQLQFQTPATEKEMNEAEKFDCLLTTFKFNK